MLLAYETDTSNKLVVRATGNDGLDGFKNAVSEVTVRTPYTVGPSLLEFGKDFVLNPPDNASPLPT